MKKCTLEDIAAACHCSITTVSRIINGNSKKYRISRKTEEAVMATVMEKGYIHSHTAQSLRSGHSGIIGLLLPSVANPYFAEMAGVIISELYKLKYTPILIDTMEDAQRLNESVRTLIIRRVEGIIAVPCGDDSSFLEQIDREVPVVLIDRFYESTSLSYVTTNNYKGGLDATRHLIGRGHERIACIQGERDSMPDRERVRGYQQAMRDAGLQDNIQIVGDEFSVQNGYLETKLLLSSLSGSSERRGDTPTAIFALSNTILLGALRAIREAGLQVPSDISIVSFDDNLYMDYLTPAITRIGQPVENMSKLAVKILCDRLSYAAERESGVHSNSQIRLLPTLLEGDSVAVRE